MSRVMMFGSDKGERDLIADSLRAHGYDVVVAREPESCPVYAGESCPRTEGCCDVLLLEQYLPAGDALDFIELLNGKCPVRMGHVALFAAILSPEELVKAIELGCKVMFTPVLSHGVETWLEGVEKEGATASSVSACR